MDIYVRKVSLVEPIPREVHSHAEIPFPGLLVWHTEVVADNGAGGYGGVSMVSKQSTYLTTKPQLSRVYIPFLA